MGASNVAAAFTHWRHLPNVPFRLLTYMALVTMDKDDPPRFWGGRDDLAMALGREVPPAPGKDDDSPAALEAVRLRVAAFESVKVGVRQLKTSGALAVIQKGKRGTQAEYSLNLTAMGKAQPSTSLPVEKADPSPGWKAQPSPFEKGEPSGLEGSPFLRGEAHPSPEEESGGLGLLGGGDRLSAITSLADDPLTIEPPQSPDVRPHRVKPTKARRSCSVPGHQHAPFTPAGECGNCRSERLAAAE